MKWPIFNGKKHENYNEWGKKFTKKISTMTKIGFTRSQTNDRQTSRDETIVLFFLFKQTNKQKIHLTGKKFF